MSKGEEITVMLARPTVELVLASEKTFDADNALVESALSLLFRQFPSNIEPAEVLLKVVTLNRLYNTSIFAVETVAEHIVGLAIDPLLKDGSPLAVDLIAEIQIGSERKKFFSFASKYCNWHNPTAYPIFDSNVDECLWAYKKQDHFVDYAAEDFYSGTMATRREKFFIVMSAFSAYYGLSSLTFKQLDKLLWLQGGALKATKAAGAS